MVKEKRKIMVPKDILVYIASDGTEFESDDACIDYEQRLKEAKALSDIEQCESLEGYPPPAGGDYNENHTFKWYRPKTVEEMDILRNIFCDCSFSDKNIGKWHCVEENEDLDAWVADEDDITGYIKEVYEKLGYTVNFIDNTAGITQDRLTMLLIELEKLLDIAPDEDSCSDDENELYAEMKNLWEALYDFVKEN